MKPLWRVTVRLGQRAGGEHICDTNVRAWGLWSAARQALRFAYPVRPLRRHLVWIRVEVSRHPGKPDGYDRQLVIRTEPSGEHQ
jgi:hypothetical protein